MKLKPFSAESLMATLSHNPFRLSRHFTTALHTHIDEHFCAYVLDKNPNLKTLETLHCKTIFDKNLRSNSFLGIKLMRAYAAFGRPHVSRHVFDEMPDKDVVLFNVMIRGFVNNQVYLEALRGFKSMSFYCVSPDHFTYPCVLKACSGSGNLRVGMQVHSSVVKVGLDSNLFVGNGLISMYGKCGCLVRARRVLDEMPTKDAISWNSMIGGYAQNGSFDDALGVCREMESLNVKHNSGTMASLLPAVSNTSAENVEFIKTMFLKSLKVDVVSFNVMIAVYVKNAMPRLAIGLYEEMEIRGVEPDSVTLASVLPACGDLSALSVGKRIHNYVGLKRLQPNLSLENALIDMYAKCGCLNEARFVFDGMKYRDVISWTSMISAYGRSGQGRDAVSLFSKMMKMKVIPDHVAFVSVLSACSHAGLLNEGRDLYRIMTNKYRLVPKMEHFACMVDLLGRAGQINEAYGIIKAMNMDPNERIWGALLSACRVYSNMDIGLIAADHLFQLAPQQAGYYVLLSNIYAKAGRWKEVTTIRSIMKDKGLKKLPGVSNVELNNKVHAFLAGDYYHPQSKKIYEELDILVGKMRELGYVPEVESALHDVEEEEKENHLAIHSEKLAIVFALINTENGTPIRITKNLRVCGDCHVAIKHISGITQREIVVRDTNRFHHFRNGVCSCGDYW